MAAREVTTPGRRRGAALALGMLALTLLASLFWPPLPPRPSASRLASLSAQRDELERRLQQRLVAAGEASLLGAPRGGLMIGIPTQLTATLLERTVTGLFGQTTIAIQDVEARAAGEVKAQVLFSKRTVGAYELQIRIRKVTGMLRPSKPTIDFADDQVNVVLPVRLVEGRERPISGCVGTARVSPRTSSAATST